MNISKLRQTEILHLWCNNRLPDKFSDGRLVKSYAHYDIYKDRIVRTGYNKRTVVERDSSGDIFIENNFDSNIADSFNSSSITPYFFRQSIPSNIKTYYFYRIPSYEVRSKKVKRNNNLYQEWVTDEINNNFWSNDLSRAAYLKSNSLNNRVISLYSSKEFIRKDAQVILEMISSSLPTYFKKVSLTKNRELIANYDKYSGWNTKESFTYKAFVSLKDISSRNLSIEDIFLTDHEKKMAEIKQFIYDYGKSTRRNGYLYSLDEFVELYQDVDRRKSFIEERERQYKEHQRLQQKIEQERQTKLYEISIENLYRFIKNEASYGYIRASYNFLALADDNTVRTSSGASVPYDHAKRAYQIYKRYFRHLATKSEQGKGKEAVREFENTVRVGHFTLTSFNEEREVYDYDFENMKLTDMKTLSGVIIGCHFIPHKEIQRFIKDNNLDWDSENENGNNKIEEKT